MLLLCLVAIFFILLIVDRWKPKKFMKVHQQLGNDWTYFPVIGNAINLIGNNQDRMKTFMQSNSQFYKNKHKSVSGWIGNVFVVVVADADQACAVLKSALGKNNVRKVTRDFFGNGSLFAPVRIWHRRRKILVPTFAPRHVDKFVTVFEAQSKVTAELLESRVGKGNFSCFDYINPYALDAICETVFGVNVGIQRKPDHPFFNAVKQLLKNIAARACQPWLQIDTIYKLLPVYGRQMRMLKICNEFIEELISKNQVVTHEKDGILEGTDHSIDDAKPLFKTFVQLMRENSMKTDKGYTIEELREEVFTLATGGTDTTTIGICFTFLLLAQHADVQDRVYREIQEVIEDPSKPLQSEDLLKLKYTRAVIKETLRLYPPVPFTLRYCKKDVRLPSGLVLPDGCNVVINIWGIQRNPEHWGEDADDFNPDRFLSGKIPNPNAFMAFSHGARNCVDLCDNTCNQALRALRGVLEISRKINIRNLNLLISKGQQYAMLSMTTTLVTILRRYRFIPATNFTNDMKNPFKLSYDLTLNDVGNFTVQIEHRDKFKQN